MESNSKNISDYLALIRRRKYYILITWGLLSLIAFIVAYSLPKTFKSTATMLMQAPMPTKISDSPGHAYGDEQIQTIYQRVITTENVLSIIDKYGLYAKQKDSVTRNDLVAEFKEKIEVELATSSLADNSTKLADIVFKMSFNYDDAVKTKNVVAELAKLLINLNDKERTQRAVKVTDFLLEELEKLNRKSQEMDGKIAHYKEQNILSLPDQLQANMASIDRTENEIRDTANQIRSTKDKIVYLEAEFARAQAEYTRTPVDSNAPKSKDEELRDLQAKYIQLSSIYSPSHPDIIRIKRELKALNSSADLTPSKEELLRQLTGIKNELSELENTYKGNHPELTKRRIEISELQQQLKTAKAERDPGVVTSTHTSNPAYLGLEVQLRSSQSELQALIQKQEFLKSKLDDTKNILSQGPKVEMEYTDMVRERDSTIKKYNQLKEKWLDAKLVQTMEEQQQGQTLTILEQPNVPTHPEKAIRKKVAIGGFFAGLIAGLGLAFLVELMDPGIRGYRSVIEATGLTPLIVIPYIESLSEKTNKLDKQRQIKEMRVWIIAGFVLLISAILYFLLSAE